MTFRKQLLTLAMCAMTLFSGCGGTGSPQGDSGAGDQSTSDQSNGDQSTSVDECTLGTDNCSANATCTDTAASFVCACEAGFIGNGVVCLRQTCDDTAQCDDDVECTVDLCSASGSCLHTPTNSLCPSNAVCHPTQGCTMGNICGTPSECVDNDPCTQDEMCNASTATCVFSPLDNDEDDEVPLVCGGTDCDDDAVGVGAGGYERCGNQVDDDCDGVIDTDATLDSDPSLRSDEDNCGSCGNVCENGTTCYQGACVACGTPGAACCNPFCGHAEGCYSGTCTNGGECILNAGTAICAASCGAASEVCCNGNTCDLGLVCGEDGTCAGPGPVTCNNPGAAVAYRLNVLTVPTPELASAGEVVGHDVDGRGTTCGVPDYAGQVDNSWIDLVSALPTLNPEDPFDMQAAIDAALGCSSASAACTRLDLVVQVRTGTGCVAIEIEDASGNTLAGPFDATLDGSGNFIGRTDSFDLSLPFGPDSDLVVLDLAISELTISGTVATNTLSSVVIGGVLVEQAFEAAVMDLLPYFGGDVAFEDIQAILANLYDVIVGQQCAGLSIGLLASGTRVP